MQIKRGLFRLWLVLSIAWATFVVAGSVEGVVTAFQRQPIYQQEMEARRWLASADAPGQKGARRLSDVLAEADAPKPWTRLGEMLGLAFGVPLCALAFGAALAWAFAGFKSKPGV